MLVLNATATAASLPSPALPPQDLSYLLSRRGNCLSNGAAQHSTVDTMVLIITAATPTAICTAGLIIRAKRQLCSHHEDLAVISSVA